MVGLMAPNDEEEPTAAVREQTHELRHASLVCPRLKGTANGCL
jgi:hypothetical protein